jgi:hypothetical protein
LQACKTAPEQPYDIAAFYWPAYHYEPRLEFIFPEKMGEWEIIVNAVPKEEGHKQPKLPLWGCLDEADPAAMDKKIEAAVSHGVNVFIFDWFWYDNQPLLESCLNDGFLKANRNRMKFYLMWANHNAVSYWDAKNPVKDSIYWKGGVDRATFDGLVDRFINKYFKEPSYYKIDGMPVFSLYELNTFIEGIGGVEAAKEALDYFRKKTIEAGFPGLHLQGILWSALPSTIEGVPVEKVKTQNDVLKYFGFNSLTNYTWAHIANPVGDYETWADASVALWQDFEKDFDIPFFPNVSIGWDPNPRFIDKWGYITNPTPEKFKLYLKKALVYADNHPNQPRMITVNAWNEWPEGSCLEPDKDNEMGYLEAVKDALNDSK